MRVCGTCTAVASLHTLQMLTIEAPVEGYLLPNLLRTSGPWARALESVRAYDMPLSTELPHPPGAPAPYGRTRVQTAAHSQNCETASAQTRVCIRP